MEKEILAPKEYVIRPCTAVRLAAAYGVSCKVLNTWLKDHQQQIGPRKGYFYSLEQLISIIELIGWPAFPIDNNFPPRH